jgi:hypothetical protein
VVVSRWCGGVDVLVVVVSRWCGGVERVLVGSCWCDGDEGSQVDDCLGNDCQNMGLSGLCFAGQEQGMFVDGRALVSGVRAV